jgi:hypothetical protein
MSDIKFVIDSPVETVGGNKCRLKTNRYANGSVVIEIADFSVETTSLETMKNDLKKFSDFQLLIVDLEKAFNTKPKESP